MIREEFGLIVPEREFSAELGCWFQLTISPVSPLNTIRVGLGVLLSEVTRSQGTRGSAILLSPRLTRSPIPVMHAPSTGVPVSEMTTDWVECREEAGIQGFSAGPVVL